MLVIAGPSGSGKSTYVFAKFREAVRAGRSDFRFVVPTATLMEHLRNEAAREGLVFRPELITTLNRLLRGATEQVSGPLLQVIVDAVLRTRHASDFARVLDAPGFPSAVAQTIEWLDGLGVTPASLARLSGAPLAGALADVWTEVAAQLSARRLTTRAGLLQSAVRDPAVGAYYFDGFSAFSQPETEFLQSLARKSDVTITLPKGVAIAGARYEEFPAPAPRALQTHHFTAASLEREAEEIARRILERGEPFREIGIALRNPDRYLRVLEATLERFGIPARFYFTAPLMENASARFLSGVVDALLSHWDHEQTLTAVRLLPHTLAGDRFDFQVRKQLPGKGLESLEALEPREPIRPLLSELQRLNIWHDRRLTPTDWARALGSLRKLSPHGNGAALDLWETALKESTKFWVAPGAAIALQEFWPVARSILRLTPLRMPDRRRNVIHVMSVQEARLWDLDVVFVPGLAETEFPRRHPQNAFLPDAALRQLQQHTGVRVPASMDRDAEEIALFDAMRDAARHELVLSFATDDQGVPSIFFPAGIPAACPAVRPAARETPDKWKPASAIVSPDLFPILQEKTERLSVTGLESYLQCAFQFFARKTLQLREAPARPEDRLRPLEQGSIVHRVLAEWYSGRPLIGPLFERIFAEECDKLRVPLSYRREMLRERMREDLERFAKYDRWPRGNPAVMETDLAIPLSEHAVVRARIDRMETLPDGSVAIIDYKYSNAKNTRDKVDDETKLQGPLYVHGVEQQHRVAAMVYYSLRRDSENVEPKPFGWGSMPGLSTKLEDMTPEWLEQGVNAARRAVVDLRGGRTLPYPARVANCRFCDFRDACRYEAAATLAAGL